MNLLSKNILLLLFPVLLFSQEQSIFWKIEKDSKTSYLLGTQHLFGANLIQQNTVIANALRDSQLIVSENTGSANAVFSQRNPYNFTKKLSAKEIDKLNEILSNKTDISKLTLKELIGQTDRSWGRYSCLTDAERNDTLLLDDYVKKYAKDNSIKNMGLETVQETLEAVEKYTYPEFSEKQLTALLKDKLDKYSQNIANKNCGLENAYRTRKIYYDFEKSVDIPILTVRNQKWIPKIKAILQDSNNVFITVGIGHLNFKNGLIEQLKALGYTVTPINL
nr:TraB/GumN family protein [Flavobacterium sp. ASV13]